MSNLKMLVVAISLTCVLAVTAFAGELQGPPCPPPIPGETEAPPCATAQLLEDSNGGEPQTLTSAETALLTTIADISVGALLSIF